MGDWWSSKIEGGIKLSLGEGVDELRIFADHIERAAEERKSLHADEKAKSWKTFVEHQLKCGAGAAHRIAKRDRTVSDFGQTVGEAVLRTISPQAVVDSDTEEWSKVWCRNELPEDEAAPWRGYCGNVDDHIGEITGEMVSEHPELLLHSLKNLQKGWCSLLLTRSRSFLFRSHLPLHWWSGFR